jgi:rRNA maturation RNase YbeY
LSLEEELVLLLIHGILHLLGYDHERSEREARLMKEKTRDLFHRIFPNKELADSCEF